MEIKEIRYRVSSSTSITPSINLKEEKSLDIYEYDSYWQYVYIHILGSTKDKEFDDFEDIELGFMQGTYFKIDDMDNEGICKFDISDSISQETYDVYTNLFNSDDSEKEGVIGINGNVFSIDRIYIENQYRNFGIGTRVITDLEKILQYSLNCTIGNFILLPSAIEKVDDELKQIIDNEEYVVLTKRLQKFYKSIGFKKIHKREHMYFNTDYIMKGTKE